MTGTASEQTINRHTRLKSNLIEAVRQHRRHCEGESCTVSLWWLLMLLKEANIDVSLEEQKEFM